MGPTGRADTIQHRLDQAASDLEDSTVKVRAAAAALAGVEAALPAAQEALAAAQGRLAGAQARVASSTVALQSAQDTEARAQSAVAAASAQLRAGRAAAGLLGRRSYEQGGVPALRALLGAADVTALLERTLYVRLVLRSQNRVLEQVSADRLRFAARSAELATATAAVGTAQATALAGAERAATVAEQAKAAEARVAALVAQRRGALAQAEAGRAADLAAYEEARQASLRLAAQLRALAEARRRAGHSVNATVGRLMWPTDGPLTSRYGMRRHPIYHDLRFHAGIDIGAPIGQVVVAAADGTVVFSGAESGYGTLVVVDHGNVGGKDLATAYAHMSALLVGRGQVVHRGDVVGRVGSEGNSTGPHLHFEVRRDGDPVDPLGWVNPP